MGVDEFSPGVVPREPRLMRQATDLLSLRLGVTRGTASSSGIAQPGREDVEYGMHMQVSPRRSSLADAVRLHQVRPARLAEGRPGDHHDEVAGVCVAESL